MPRNRPSASNRQYICRYIKLIASRIATLEAKKSEVSIGNIREVLKCLATMEASVRAVAYRSPSMLEEPKPEQYPLYWMNAYAEDILCKKLGVRKNADTRKSKKAD